VGKNLRTEKALIDSGAYVPGDFEDAPLIMKQGNEGHTPVKRMNSQAEYDAKLATDNAKASKNYQAWKNKRK
jgi:hypothetical protein